MSDHMLALPALGPWMTDKEKEQHRVHDTGPWIEGDGGDRRWCYTVYIRPDEIKGVVPYAQRDSSETCLICVHSSIGYSLEIDMPACKLALELGNIRYLDKTSGYSANIGVEDIELTRVLTKALGGKG